MFKVYLGLGSNLGDKKENIIQALNFLRDHPQIKIVQVSSLYKTEPVGYIQQDWFLNGVVKIETSLSPYKLLDYCQTIEAKLKRERLVRWGPRTIDIDILLYEGVTLEEEKLTIPHPRMTERAFVMIPLYEIDSDLIINGLKKDFLLHSLKGQQLEICGKISTDF